MDYYTSKPYFKDAFDNEADKKKLYDAVAAKIRSIIDHQGVFSVTHGGAIFVLRKDEEKTPQKIESARRFLGPDIAYANDEATAAAVESALQKNHIAKVVNFPPRAEALFAFAQQLGRPMSKYNQKKMGVLWIILVMYVFTPILVKTQVYQRKEVIVLVFIQLVHIIPYDPDILPCLWLILVGEVKD
jgi:hypothetical protein